MNLAEFFIKISVISSGSVEALDKLGGKLDKAAFTAAKYSVGLTAVNSALLLIINRSLNAGLGLERFRLATGESTDSLQRWQYASDRAIGSGTDIAGAIKSIQDAQAAIALGEGNVAPWQLLGINPGEDPFKVLEDLRKAILQFQSRGQEGLARHIVGQFGIGDDLFAALASPNFDINALQRQLIITRQQQQEMVRLNLQWQEFRRHLEIVGMTLAVTLAPAFERLIPRVEEFIEKGLKLLGWLTSSNPAAEAMRDKIVKLTEVVLVGAPALGALATALKAVSAAISLVSLAISPEFMALLAGVGLVYFGYKRYKDISSGKARSGFDMNTFSGGIGVPIWKPPPSIPSKVEHKINVSVTAGNSKDAHDAAQTIASELAKALSSALDQAPIPGQ